MTWVFRLCAVAVAFICLLASCTTIDLSSHVVWNLPYTCRMVLLGFTLVLTAAAMCSCCCAGRTAESVGTTSRQRPEAG
jgi:hypothetical protein